MNDLYNEIINYIPYDEYEKELKSVFLDFISKNSDCLLRDNKIAHITVSAWITNQKHDKVLMIFHNIYKSWAWVGGHADGESNLLLVIKREIEEETGLSNIKLLKKGIYGLNIVNVSSHYKNKKIVLPHLHLDIEYYFEASEKDNLRIKEDENSGVKWIKISDVMNKVSEEKMKDIYQKLIDKMKVI